MNNQKRYEKEFGIKSKNRSKNKRALAHALDIRKFEIELYWKRATYFWALIAVAFAGFFAVLNADDMSSKKEFYAFIIGCIGLVFTWAWFLVNKGSKSWQENWENHVDMLEDNIIGPLYKTRLHRPDGVGSIIGWVTDPATLSVSKINQWVSFFTLIIWMVLIFSTLPEWSCTAPLSWSRVIIGGGTVIFCLLMCCLSSSSMHNYSHIMSSRSSKIL